MSQKGRGLIKAAFDTDNFLMRISEKVLDIVTVNLLFVVTCFTSCNDWSSQKLVSIRQCLKSSKVDVFQFLEPI